MFLKRRLSITLKRVMFLAGKMGLLDDLVKLTKLKAKHVKEDTHKFVKKELKKAEKREKKEEKSKENK